MLINVAEHDEYKPPYVRVWHILILRQTASLVTGY